MIGLLFPWAVAPPPLYHDGRFGDVHVSAVTSTTGLLVWLDGGDPALPFTIPTVRVEVAQYLSKGRPALVSGRLQSRSWEQEGQKRSKVEVVAQDVTFLGGPGGSGAQGGSDDDGGNSAPAAKAGGSKKAATDDVVIEDIGDEPINLDDIPF